MKRAFQISLNTFYCAFLLQLPLLLPAQGIQFEHGTWAEVLAKAKSEGKPVFLDAMTSWCGPCKLMSKEVFPDPAVGAFFNTKFVSIKMDMERGEGANVSNRYKVSVYPTLLFVDGDGVVQHRSVGYHSPEELVELAKKALDSTKNLASFERQYAAGDRHREFLLQYLEAKTAAYDPDAGQIANDFLKVEDDYSTPENMDILMQHIDDPYSKGFKFLLSNQNIFEEKYGKRAVKTKIEGVFESYLQSHPELQLGEVQRLYGTVYPEGGEVLASRYRLVYYWQKSETENFALAAIDHYARYPSEDADELNEMAWIFAEEITDPAQLRTALDWSKKAVSLQETYYNQYTQAKLLGKLGKRKPAQKAAERSLQLAQAEGEDTTLIEELLESLKKK